MPGSTSPPSLLHPQTQNHRRWKAAHWGPSWCGMTPRLGPCAHALKGKSITEASEGTWPSEATAQDTQPEAAGQEPVMAERPGLRPATGPSICAEPIPMATEAARSRFPVSSALANQRSDPFPFTSSKSLFLGTGQIFFVRKFA